MIVALDGLFEIIGTILIFEFHYHRDWLVGFHFCRDFCTVHDYLRMENLLIDALIEVVGNGAYSAQRVPGVAE